MSTNIDRAAEVIESSLREVVLIATDGTAAMGFGTELGDQIGEETSILARALADDGLLVDDHHSTAELYDYRMAYNALLFNEWARAGKHDVHKSWRHSDGELCFGGDWFIVCATTPHGLVSNHYHSSNWHYFDIPEREVPVEYDGHTPAEALRRLMDTAAEHAEGVGTDG